MSINLFATNVIVLGETEAVFCNVATFTGKPLPSGGKVSRKLPVSLGQ